VPAGGNVVARNVFRGGTWMKVFWHAREDMLSVKDSLVCEDPRLASSASHGRRSG